MRSSQHRLSLVLWRTTDSSPVRANSIKRSWRLPRRSWEHAAIRSARLGRQSSKGSHRKSRPCACACRARPTGGNARAGACDQREARRAWIDARSHRAGCAQTPRTGRLAQRTRRRHAGRQSGQSLIIDSNPVYAAPATLGFAEALTKVAFSVALMLDAERDESSGGLGRAHGACVGNLE